MPDANDKKQQFITLLHELFQLDQPELDFGFYKIMHAKSGQITRFIDEELSEHIDAVFAGRGNQSAAEQAEYLEPRMELVTLNEYRESVPEQDEYEIRVDQNQDVLIKDIRKLCAHFSVANTGAFDSTASAVNGDRLDAHLFNPLLHSLDDRIRIEPVALNDSEYTFVQDFKRWLATNDEQIKANGEAFYLLRNRVFRGVGFFEAGGFWPDFILWHIDSESVAVLARQIAGYPQPKASAQVVLDQ